MTIRKFQEGGAAPVAAAPAPSQEDQMIQQLAQMAQEIIQQMGPDAAAMLAQIIMEMLQQAQPVNEAPAEQQFMRCGGKIKKAKCGKKMSKKC